VSAVESVRVRALEDEARVEESEGSSFEGACFRLRDLSWARRDLRSLAAAERASWEDMVVWSRGISWSLWGRRCVSDRLTVAEWCVCAIGEYFVWEQYVVCRKISAVASIAESSKSFGGDVPASSLSHKRSLHLELFRQQLAHDALAVTPRITAMAR
jgi:hypothetical protein